MTKNDLVNQLNKIINAKRVFRDTASDYVIEHIETFPFLLELIFKDQDRTAIKSAWVLELVCQKNISLINNHLHFFIANLNKITDESALRPIAKVCMFILNSNKNKELKLTKTQKEKLIEINFDWLINKHKVATKVFAMTSLYLLAKEHPWVSEELKLILKTNASKESMGYGSRAKNILKKM